MLHNIVGLDFETYASTDLPTHGLHRYVNCPDFRPLLAAVIWFDDENPSGFEGQIFDFVEDYEGELARFLVALGNSKIVAHNAGFEQSVLARMGIDLPSERFVDSAVLARAAGAAGKLEAAAPQLLGSDKLAIGFELIKLFSIPGKYQEASGSTAFDPQIRLDHFDEWAEFARYCGVDAELSLRLADALLPRTSEHELANNSVTMDMNNTGWHVDLELVRNMHLRYQINLANIEAEFRKFTGADDLNLNSTPQLIAWCAKRGVRATSFDEAHVARMLVSIERKLHKTMDFQASANLAEVRALLHTKQALGGSSLKKLQVILDTTGTDGRLHDQYLHCGAGATYRTTGRGVQMQNLKRLNGVGDDMELLFEEDTEWDNGRLASNLRQVFTATDPNGFLIVGDFASVESRGLAWQAGEDWKLEAYRNGEDLYMVQAGLMLNKQAGQVTKPERQLGKVGELSCGYGAGPEAVRDFAAKMGLTLSDGEAIKLVKDWRANNPKTVDYWQRLHDALVGAVGKRVVQAVNLPHGVVEVFPFPAPESLRKQVGDPHLVSLRVQLMLRDGLQVVDRVIHGTTIKGHNLTYWKPSERKTGDLWVDTFVNPKTKRQQLHSVYGGKLAGLLTQSLCREVFFTSLREIHRWCGLWPMENVRLVGQFHDEIVLDWAPDPGGIGLQSTKLALEGAMSLTILPGFPLSAEVKHDYRYTK